MAACLSHVERNSEVCETLVFVRRYHCASEPGLESGSVGANCANCVFEAEEASAARVDGVRVSRGPAFLVRLDYTELGEDRAAAWLQRPPRCTNAV